MWHSCVWLQTIFLVSHTQRGWHTSCSCYVYFLRFFFCTLLYSIRTLLFYSSVDTLSWTSENCSFVSAMSEATLRLSCLYCLKQLTFVLSVLSEAAYICIVSIVWSSVHLCCQYCLKQRTFVLSVLSEAAYFYPIRTICSSAPFALPLLWTSAFICPAIVVSSQSTYFVSQWLPVAPHICVVGIVLRRLRAHSVLGIHTVLSFTPAYQQRAVCPAGPIHWTEPAHKVCLYNVDLPNIFSRP